MRRPLVTITLAVAAAVAPAILAGACSDDGGDGTGTTAPTDRPPAALSGTALCEDPPDDADGPIELRSVGVVVRGEDLVVTWAVEPVTVAGTTTWSVIARPYQLGIEDPGGDGQPTGFVVDLDAGERADRTEGVRVRQDQAQLVVPLADLPGIAGDWTATVSVDGEESDACAPTPLPGT